MNVMKKIFCLSLVAILGALSLSCSKSDAGDKGKDPISKYEFPPYSKIVTPGCTKESYAKNLLDIKLKVKLEGAGGTSSPWADIGMSIATSAGKTIGTKSAEALMSYIFGSSQSDQTAAALREISEQLDEMNKKLDDIRQLADDIMKKLQEIEFNQMNSAYSEQFYRHFADICNTNMRYYNKLRSDMSEEELWDVLSEWAKLTIDGSPAPDSFSRIYDIIRNFSYTYNGHPCNVLSVFDACVFQTTPFESEGYDTRDQFRASLAAGMATAALLSSLYFCLDGDEYLLDRIVEQLDWLDAFLRLGKEPTDTDVNAVIRDNDNVICQIMDARLKLPKDAVYKRESINGSGWHKGTDMAFLDGDVDITKSRNSQFTMDELKAIQQFFYPGSGRDVSVDVLPILDAYGLVLPKDWITSTPHLLYKEFEGGYLNRGYNPNKREWKPAIHIGMYWPGSDLSLYSGDHGVDVEYGGDSSHEGFGGSYTEFKLLHGFAIPLPDKIDMMLALGVDKMERY